MKPFFPDQEFKALLFDFDGTIADTMAPHFTAWNKALQLYGVSLSREQHLEWAGRPTREIVKLLNELHKTEMTIDEISKAKEFHYMSSIPDVKEIIPVTDIIRANYGKKKMAIVSGSRRKQVETTVRHLALEKYFDTLICAEDYTNGKPAPDCFLKAADLLGVAPAECLVFEDAVLGVKAAHNAGMACIRVTENPDLGHQLSVSPRHQK